MNKALVVQLELDFKNLFVGASTAGETIAFIEKNGFELWTFHQ